MKEDSKNQSFHRFLWKSNVFCFIRKDITHSWVVIVAEWTQLCFVIWENWRTENYNSVLADAYLCYPQQVDLQLPGHRQELL